MSASNQFTLNKQSGFSIVELMIAGLLGLILLAGVIQLFLGSNKNYTMQDELATIQENGRFTMMFLEDKIQRGGWQGSGTSAIEAIDIMTAGASTEGADGASDSFTVSYTAATDGTHNIDCNGATTGSIVSNRFYVSDDGDFMCQGSGGGAAQPLISNVEQFQVLYGVETDVGCPDGVVNAYFNRATLPANAVILSVRVALLLTSEANVLPEAESKSFDILDLTYNSPSDRRVRRIFQQTVYMPNAYFATAGSPDNVINCMMNQI